MRCLAIDDEPLALMQLKRFAEKLPEIELVATCHSVGKALEIMKNEHIDLIFLDIEMPAGNGMDFAKTLTVHQPYIIFVTAYAKYAIDGFRVEAVDYLLKPLVFAEFEKAVKKAESLIGMKKASNPEAEETIFVKSNGITRSIRLSDIVYIKSLSEYVQIKLAAEKQLLTTLDSLKRFESILPAKDFMRIHKSFLVNLNYVQEADRQHVKVLGIDLPVGEKYRASLKSYLSNNHS